MAAGIGDDNVFRLSPNFGFGQNWCGFAQALHAFPIFREELNDPHNAPGPCIDKGASRIVYGTIETAAPKEFCTHFGQSLTPHPHDIDGASMFKF